MKLQDISRNSCDIDQLNGRSLICYFIYILFILHHNRLHHIYRCISQHLLLYICFT